MLVLLTIELRHLYVQKFKLIIFYLIIFMNFLKCAWHPCHWETRVNTLWWWICVFCSLCFYFDFIYVKITLSNTFMLRITFIFPNNPLNSVYLWSPSFCSCLNIYSVLHWSSFPTFLLTSCLSFLNFIFNPFVLHFQ